MERHGHGPIQAEKHHKLFFEIQSQTYFQGTWFLEPWTPWRKVRTKCHLS